MDFFILKYKNFRIKNSRNKIEVPLKKKQMNQVNFHQNSYRKQRILKHLQ